MAKARGRSSRGPGGGKSRQQQNSRRPPSQKHGGPRRDEDAIPGSTGEGRRHKGPGGDRVEGRQAVRELLIAGSRPVREIVMQAGLDTSDILEDIVLLAEDRRVPIREVGRGSFDSLSHTESAQGVLAEAAPLPTVDVEELLELEGVPFLVMLDGVTDPHNLGAVSYSRPGSCHLLRHTCASHMLEGGAEIMFIIQ